MFLFLLYQNLNRKILEIYQNYLNNFKGILLYLYYKIPFKKSYKKCKKLHLWGREEICVFSSGNCCYLQFGRFIFCFISFFFEIISVLYSLFYLKGGEVFYFILIGNFFNVYYHTQQFCICFLFCFFLFIIFLSVWFLNVFFC